MKYLILSLLTVAFIFDARANSISSVSCDSFSKWGFLSSNETGTFTYSLNPFKISFNIGGQEFIVSDSSHVCTVDTQRNDVTFTVKEFPEGASEDIAFVSNVTSAAGTDGGYLMLRKDQTGAFNCLELPGYDAGVDLSHCKIK